MYPYTESSAYCMFLEVGGAPGGCVEAIDGP